MSSTTKQSPPESHEDVIKKFLEAMQKKDGDSVERLKQAFNVLSNGQEYAQVSADDLHRGIEKRGLEVALEEVKERILHVKKKDKYENQYQINCEEFINIVQSMGTTAQIPPETHEDVINAFVEAMKKKDDDSVKGLEQAFNILSKGQEYAQVSVDDLHRGIENHGLKVALEEFKERILHVKKKDKYENQYQIKREEFINIVTSLEGPTVVDQLKEIYEILRKPVKERIVLHGESGVGKTWMARKVAGLALRKRIFNVAIWVYLNREYKGLSLHESIAYQLYGHATFKKAEVDEARKELEEKDEARKANVNEAKDKAKQENVEEAKDKPKPEEVKETKETKKDKIEVMIRKALQGKKVLLILDDEGSDNEKGDENELLVELKQQCHQVLITSRAPPASTSQDIGVTMSPLSWNDSKSLVDGVEKLEGEIKILAGFFIDQSRRFPAEVLIIAKVVRYLGKTEPGLQKLRSYREVLENGITDLKVENLLIRGYDRLPISVLIDCYSTETRRDKHFLHRVGMVNFNELICYWIMEGHLGKFDRIKDAYEEGHRVLMELMDCGLLQKQEADYVTPSGANFKLDIHDHDEFFRKIHSGLAMTFDMKLGKVAWADGMIRTISSSGQEEEKLKLSTLLLDGDHLGEVALPAIRKDDRIGEQLPANRKDDGIGEQLLANHIDDSKDVLENLVIFNPTRQHFQVPLFERPPEKPDSSLPPLQPTVKMPKLRLLVLRGCLFLDSIEDNFQWKKSSSSSPTKESSSNPAPSPNPVTIFDKFEDLKVLEISGPNSLIKSIPDELFQKMPNLKTLNMSSLHKIESLPISFYRLKSIEFLILRGCSSLKELASLDNFKGLQVLDVSEAISFEKFHDKNLKENSELRILNLSKTKIKTLPIINSCSKLKFILLSDCKELQRIRMISRLQNLQIFDISGAILVEEFCDPSLEELKSLVILNVSSTAIRRLPSNISKPRYLYLKDCNNLKRVPPIEGLSRVEVIDLSGSCHLGEIRTEFFKDIDDLRELNLSKTGVKHLPFLSKLGTLRRLVLSQCHNLEKLEHLSSLGELEFLDLSGCSALKEIKDGSFDEMKHLYYLNLSGIQVDRLPSLSKLVMLKELYVRDCPNLTELPGIQELQKVEVLDYSGTPLKSTPSFSKPDRHPRVIGASLDNIDYQQLQKKLGVSSEVTSVEPESTDITPDDLRQCKWSISNWQVKENVYDETLGEPVYGVQFFRLWQKYPSLLTETFSRFHFLVYPSEVETKLPNKSLYRSELSLRDIYFEQVSQEKLAKRLEIREFKEFPRSLRHLLKQAQFVVLVDNPFFKSLLDLDADNITAMKACWIESCDELKHVVESEKVEDSNKPGESAESKGDTGKLAKGKGDTGEKAEKSKGDAGEKKAESKGDAGEKKAESKGDAGEKAESKGDAGEKKAESTGDAGEKKAEGKGDAGEKAESKGDTGEKAESKGDAGEKKAESKGNAGEKAESKGDTGEKAESKGDTGEKKAQSKGDAGEKKAESKGDAGEMKAESDAGEKAESKGDTGEKKAESKGDAGEEKAESKGDAGEKAEGKANAGEEKAESKGNAVEKAEVKGDTGETAEGKGDAGEKAEGKGDAGEKAEGKGNTGESTESKGDTGENVESKGDKTEKAESKGTVEKAESKGGDTGELAESKGDTGKNFTDIVKNIQILWISDAIKLGSISNGDIQSISFKGLKSLYLEYCPQLCMLCSSPLQLESLEVLYVKYCQNLKTLFTDDSAELNNLKELHLWGLEELKKIACKVPSLQTLRVGECPLLEHVINASTEGDELHEVDGHANLEVLHIKFCDKLKTICESSPEEGYFPELRELELLALPELKKVAIIASPSLHSLKVSECPSLEHIVGNSKVEDLKTLEVKYCDELKKIFEHGGLDWGKVEKMELLSLSELDNINGSNLAPPLQENWMIWGCPKLEEPPLEQKHVEV